MAVTPYKNQQTPKKVQIAQMFDNIAGNYDFLNGFLSMGIDTLWRKDVIKLLSKCNPKIILDVATGTADLAIEAARIYPSRIVGVDISQKMLEIAEIKIKQRGLEHIIQLQLGDSENLPFEKETFDAVMVAFGVRNFEDLERGLTDIYRVLKKNGTVLILEFSQPQKYPLKSIYNFYFNNVLPIIGKYFSKDATAYTYLPKSVEAFPYGEQFLDILIRTGFNSVKCTSLTFGISSIYIGKK